MTTIWSIFLNNLLTSNMFFRKIISINSVIYSLFFLSIISSGSVYSDSYRTLCNDKSEFFNNFRIKLLSENNILKWEGDKVLSDNLSRINISTHIMGKVEYLKRYSDIDISIKNQSVSNFFIFPANDIKKFLVQNSESIKLFFPDRDIKSRIDRIKDENIAYSFVGLSRTGIASGFLIIENHAKKDASIESIDSFINNILGLNERKIFDNDEAGFGFTWTDLMYLKLIYSSGLAPEELLSGSDRAFDAARNSRFCK